MPQQVRFTPEELQAIAESNNPFTSQELQKLHQDDASTYLNFRISKQRADHGTDQADGVDWPIVGATAALVPGMPMMAGVGGKILSELPSLVRAVGYTGLATLAAKLGIPASAMEVGGLYAAMRGMGGGAKGAAAGAATEAETIEQALAKKGINSANVGKTIPARTPLPTDSDPVTLNLKRRSPVPPPVATPGGLGNDALDVEKKIFGPQGSEAATFGVRPPAYSPNISTGATADDILEMLTGSSHGAGTPDGSPIMYHGSDGPATRSSVDKLKRATRRSPK